MGYEIPNAGRLTHRPREGVTFAINSSGSAVDFPPVADRDDDDLQNAVVDFVNRPVITHANPPRITAFKFLHVRRTRVGLQSRQPRQNPAGHIIGQTIQLLPNRFGQDDLKSHFPLCLRSAR